MAEALYRKYRPQVFSDVVGQEAIERTIKNALETNRLSHAYLFCGPRGTGKTTTARLLAKALLCQSGQVSTPDGSCEDCQMIANGEHPDVYELDAASRTGVDNVREEIISRVQYAPTRGRSKVYIIDEVHMLSTAAFNALLKTLEEPPSHVVFVLCTTDPQKVPATILSRCQRFDFQQIDANAIAGRLAEVCKSEAVEFDQEALELIARRAQGGLRNALTSLEQIIAFENGAVSLEGASYFLGANSFDDVSKLMRLIASRDTLACFKLIEDIADSGMEFTSLARDMAEHVRNLYVFVLSRSKAETSFEDELSNRLSLEEMQLLKEEASLFGEERIARLFSVLGDLQAELKKSANQRLSFEIALTRMLRPQSDLTLEALAERIESLERVVAVAATCAPEAFTRGVVPENSTTISPETSAAEFRSPVASSGVAHATTDDRNASRTAPAERESCMDVAELPHKTEPIASTVGESGSQTPDRTAPMPEESVPQLSNLPAANTEANHLHTDVDPQKLSGIQNPASLQRQWQAVMSEIKRIKQAYAVLFLNTKVHYDKDLSGINIEFPKEASFAFSAAQKPEVQACLSNLIVKVFGDEIPFCLTQNGSITCSAPEQGRAMNSTSKLTKVPEASKAIKGSSVTQATQAGQVGKVSQATQASQVSQATQASQASQATQVTPDFDSKNSSDHADVNQMSVGQQLVVSENANMPTEASLHDADLQDAAAQGVSQQEGAFQDITKQAADTCFAHKQTVADIVQDPSIGEDFAQLYKPEKIDEDGAAIKAILGNCFGSLNSFEEVFEDKSSSF